MTKKQLEKLTVEERCKNNLEACGIDEALATAIAYADIITTENKKSIKK